VSRATWAVVVARTGRTAKTRLAPVLTPGQRAALALAMLDDLLAACGDAGLAMIAVVDTLDGQRLVERRGACGLLDDGTDMNRAVRAGAAHALAAGADSLVILPGDLPDAGPDDLRALAAAGAPARAVVVAPDRAGAGTNGLLLRPPDVIATAFGPGSAARHLALGRAAGADVARLFRPGLARDVDRPDDLAALVGASTGRATAAALARLHVRPP
jgi:2-phospho-L-lactate guanylyltransferase